MVNEKLRKALANMCEEQGLEESEQPILLDNMSYDNSIVGVTEDNRIVYDYNKMVEELMEDEGWSETDAIEWLDYNTIRAIPYMESRGRAPVILYDTAETILEKYGE